MCSSACDTASRDDVDTDDAWVAATPQASRGPSPFDATPSPGRQPRLRSPLSPSPRSASLAPSEASTADTARYALFDAAEPLMASSEEETEFGEAADGPAPAPRPSSSKRSYALAAVSSPNVRAASRGVTTGIVIGLLLGYALRAYAGEPAAPPPSALPKFQAVLAHQAAQLREGLAAFYRATPDIVEALATRALALRDSLAEAAERGGLS